MFAWKSAREHQLWFTFEKERHQMMSRAIRNSSTTALTIGILALGGLTATPANAALTEGPAASASQSTQTVNGLSQSTINKADQFVHRSGSTYSFDAANARSVLSSSETSQVQSAVDNWNTNLQLASSETGVGGIAGGIVSAALAASAGVQGLCRDEKGEATYYAPISPTPTIVCNPLA
ncbi:hypothetical protein [Propioniferax innocua]|nr:hypothetical protein [Propioniferax innocua]